MPRFLVKLDDDLYTLWSTVVDAPVSPCGITRANALEHFTDREVASADAGEHDDVFKWNRAGQKEESLTREQIITLYAPNNHAMQKGRT